MAKGPDKSRRRSVESRSNVPKKPSSINAKNVAIGGAVLAVVAGVVFRIQNQAVVSKEGKDVPVATSRMEKPKEKDVVVPTFEISDGLEANPFAKSPGLTPQQLDEISKTMVEEIRRGILDYVVPEQKNHPEDKRGVLAGFIMQTAEQMGRMNSGIAAEINLLMKNQDRDIMYRVLRYINAYLLDQGYYLSVAMNDAGDDINLYPVLKKKTVAVSDYEGTEKVPALVLGKGLLLEENGPNGFTPAPFHDHALVLPHNVERASDGILDYYRQNGIKPPCSDAQLRGDMEQDFLRHEAMHVVLARRFPRTEKKMMEGRPFSLNTQVQIPGSPALAQINGVFAPTSPSELVAWGAQIANSNNAIPYSHLVSFSEDAQPQNRLVERLLPLATLDAASPQSPIRARIIQDMLSGSAQHDDFRTLVFDPSFSMEDRKKSGEIIYRRGYEMVRKLDQE